jgi:hypothetical protein
MTAQVIAAQPTITMAIEIKEIYSFQKSVISEND